MRTNAAWQTKLMLFAQKLLSLTVKKYLDEVRKDA